MEVERPLGDLRPRGDVLHPHLVERALRKELDRRIDDPPHLGGIGRSHASPRPPSSRRITLECSTARTITGSGRPPRRSTISILPDTARSALVRNPTRPIMTDQSVLRKVDCIASSVRDKPGREPRTWRSQSDRAARAWRSRGRGRSPRRGMRRGTGRTGKQAIGGSAESPTGASRRTPGRGSCWRLPAGWRSSWAPGRAGRGSGLFLARLDRRRLRRGGCDDGRQPARRRRRAGAGPRRRLRRAGDAPGPPRSRAVRAPVDQMRSDLQQAS